MEGLNLGSKEIISVNVTDRLATITDLSPYTGEFKVTKHDDTTVTDWAAVNALVGMRVDCLVDTSTGYSKGRHKLYTRISIGAERPILGPFDFDVN